MKSERTPKATETIGVNTLTKMNLMCSKRHCQKARGWDRLSKGVARDGVRRQEDLTRELNWGPKTPIKGSMDGIQYFCEPGWKNFSHVH